jgi:hypothetical protein
MAKSPKTAHSKAKASKAPGAKKAAAGSKVLGTTFDGVQILKPKFKATHFTNKELRDAIARVRSSR